VVIVRQALDRFAPHALPQYRDALLAGNEVLALYSINETPERFCHFLAQIDGECGGLRILEEDLSFASAVAIRAVWPMRFPTLTSAEAYVRNPRSLAERVYGNRFGNRPGDGWRFRGRGFVQITGRSNYREMGNKLGIPLEDHPELACHPDHALTIACETWMAKQLDGERDMNRLADLNKLEALTYRMTGAYSDLDQRRQTFAQAWAMWGEGDTPDRARETNALERGDRGGRVDELNARLKYLGLFEGIVAEPPQHVFTLATYKALRRLQHGRGLALAGVAGADTWAALDSAMDRAMRASMPRGGLRSVFKRAMGSDRPVDRAARRLAEVGGWSIALAFFALAFVGLYMFALIEPGRLGSSAYWLPLLFAGVVLVGGVAMWLAARPPAVRDGGAVGMASRGGVRPAAGSFVSGEEEPVRQGLNLDAAGE
jgi:putative chitinase